MRYILIFFAILIAVPSQVHAITNNQIDAEVQIACPDGKGNIFFGSGTVISSKGVIITNRHVVTDADGATIRYCLIGKSVGLDQPADYSDELVSETKYINQNTDVDVALLYIINNSTFSYFNITGSSSSNLTNGDTIDVFGYPGYNDLKLTYTTGQFIDSYPPFNSDYLEASSYINHGNSGGSAYNADRLVGIPTFGLTTSAGQRYFYLKIDSVKQWMESALGSNYQNKILGYQPTGGAPNISLPYDNEPPVIKNAPRDVFWYKAFDDNGNSAEGMFFDNNNPFKDLYVSNAYRNIQIKMLKDRYTWSMDDMDKGSGLSSVLYSFSDDIINVLNKPTIEKEISYNESGLAELTPVLTLPNKSGTYYINIRFKDKSGNVSEPYILTYVYEPDAYLNLVNVKYYSDSNYTNMIGNYDFSMMSEGWAYPQYFQYCATRYKDVYVKWQYENNYNSYSVNHYNYFVGEMSISESQATGGITTTSYNKYKVSDMNLGGKKTASYQSDEPKTNLYYGHSLCYNGDCEIEGSLTSFLLKPQTVDSNPSFEGKNRTIIFAYNPNLAFDFLCGAEDESLGRNQWGQAFYTLSSGKSLIEDSFTFDQAQESIAKSLIVDIPSNDDRVPDSTQNISIDKNLLNRLKGYILLQVEEHGEAWYVDPTTESRYYMKDGPTAYEMMRYFGLGITNVDLEKVLAGNTTLINRLKGKILLQVEAHGEAYWIHPTTGEAHYLKNGAEAYRLMRYYSLGITNSDLNKIPIRPFVPIGIETE